MSATLIGGRRNQPYINRGALDRLAARFAGGAFFGSLGLNFFLAAGLAYVGSLPREKPVVLVQHDNGAYTSFTENVAPSEVGNVRLLSDWFAAFRLGSNDPQSMSARQVAVLIPGTGDVKQQVIDYNQSIADSHAVVSPTIRSVRSVAGSPFQYEIDEDEVVATQASRVTHSVVAYVTVAFDDARANLHDPLLNPYGMYIEKVQIAQLGGRK